MIVRTAILFAGSLALSIAAPALFAQQGQEPQGTVGKGSVKAKSQATVQGGGQGGPGQGQLKSKSQATVQGPGQGPQGGQSKAKVDGINKPRGAQSDQAGPQTGPQGGGQLKMQKSAGKSQGVISSEPPAGGKGRMDSGKMGHKGELKSGDGKLKSGATGAGSRAASEGGLR